MRVGHDAGIEVDEVQVLEPAGRAGQRGEQHGGTRWGGQKGTAGAATHLQRSSWAARSTEARLPRSTSTVETCAAGYSCSTRSRVASAFWALRQARHRWMRPSSPSSRRHRASPTPLQRHGGQRQAQAVPSLLSSLPPHTPRPPSPRAHPLAPVTNTTRSIPVQTALPARPLPPPYIRYPPSPPAYVIAPPPSSANGRGRGGRGHAGGGVMVGRGAGRRVWAWPVRPRPPRALSPRPLGAPLFGAAPPRVAPGAARKARRHRASLQRVLPYIQVHLLNIYMPQQ